MLFNSYEFLFAFLPVALIGYFAAQRIGPESAITWLVVASLFFYGWWNPDYLVLLVGSMLVNYGFGRQLSNAHRNGRVRSGRIWLFVGVALNLLLLGWFKYANFAVDTANLVGGTQFHFDRIVLPLAISFFTFQQIAYLVDARQGITREYRFMHYALFVTFFPQLIAGPIVHHKEMLPQFMREGALRPHLSNIAIGTTILLIGLFKKVVLADSAALYASPVFDAAAGGSAPSFFIAWGGALAYTLQLYFDFSGYSDMAIGAARLFGIRLPVNFHSPYKATSIVEFWRRWHMTLSRFLRDYLYIPLGGNRGRGFARYRNLMITMVLGGLWHGAGWTFVAWGALHGAYLIINHGWTRWRSRYLAGFHLPAPIGKCLAWSLTFAAIVVGWVFFRATTFDAALAILSGMAGLNGVAIPSAIAARLGDLWPMLEGMGVTSYIGGGSSFVYTWVWIALLLPIALWMPNTQQIMVRAEPALNPHVAEQRDELRAFPWLERRLRWAPTRTWAVTIALVGTTGVLALTRVSEFLYFQF